MLKLRDLLSFAWFGSFVFFLFLAPHLLSTLPREEFRVIAPVIFSFFYYYSGILIIFLLLTAFLANERSSKFYSVLVVSLLLTIINLKITNPLTNSLRNHFNDPVQKALFYSAHNKDLALFICEMLLSLSLVLMIVNRKGSTKPDIIVVDK